MKDEQEFIERRIIIGLIVSTEFQQQVQRYWNSSLLESMEFRQIADWCTEYFAQYKQAPGRDIELIFTEKLPHLPKNTASYLEEALHSLSEEYQDDCDRAGQFNSGYLLDRTVEYLKARELSRHNQEVKMLVDSGEIKKAEQMAQSYRSAILEAASGIELGTELADDAIRRAFSESAQPIVKYPGALGEMWNPQLVRGGFFTLLAPEKRGKSWWLLDIALRALQQKANVAFFEAGDMTESQVLRRIAVRISGKSDQERYCKARFRPVGDCLRNQANDCKRSARNCDHGIFDLSLDALKSKHAQEENITMGALQQKIREYPNYEPCDAFGCSHRIGSVWLTAIPQKRPLNADGAVAAIKKFVERYKRRFKLHCFPAKTLTVSQMRTQCQDWERYDGFVSDVIAVDYADLLSSSDGVGFHEFRHNQDWIWASLRALSQERHVLLLSATQADAQSYTRHRLSAVNFSEDKRKLAHVTAQYGLNQDFAGREKHLGIMRINEIVVREGEFFPDNEVCVLQDLASGRPFLESFSNSSSFTCPK